MDVWFCMAGTSGREAQIALEDILIRSNVRSPKRARKTCAFRLTLTYMEVGKSDRCPAHACSCTNSQFFRTVGCREFVERGRAVKADRGVSSPFSFSLAPCSQAVPLESG